MHKGDSPLYYLSTHKVSLDVRLHGLHLFRAKSGIALFYSRVVAKTVDANFMKHPV